MNIFRKIFKAMNKSRRYKRSEMMHASLFLLSYTSNNRKVSPAWESRLQFYLKDFFTTQEFHVSFQPSFHFHSQCTIHLVPYNPMTRANRKSVCSIFSENKSILRNLRDLFSHKNGTFSVSHTSNLIWKISRSSYSSSKMRTIIILFLKLL